ncbi:MAG: purine-nucleoside phosphorylase [Desulfuromonas sp.]|nr:MAG: purine-nucleoside phosphorylase [Desulfuromonas sp.]
MSTYRQTRQFSGYDDHEDTAKVQLLGDVLPAVKEIRNRFGDLRPECAIVLGSGLASLANQLSRPQSIDYSDLPHFPSAAVTGHEGRFWLGELFGLSVVLFQGRYHYYEGYSAYQVTAPVRLAKELGCRRIILTNAAGGITDRTSPGSFMLVTDHINLVGASPLRGARPAPFIDLCSLYRHDFFQSLKESLLGSGVDLQQGVLAWMPGPSYETPAEIRGLERLGADAVSMSTIPEAIMAQALGLETVALSLIANKAAGKSGSPLSHHDVLSTGKTAAAKLPLLLAEVFSHWA